MSDLGHQRSDSREDKGKDRERKPSLEALRHAHNRYSASNQELEEKRPNLLTGDRMMYSLRFREQLQGREKRNRFQKAFGQSNTRSAYAQEMHQSIRERSELLRQQYQDIADISPIIDQATKRIEYSSKVAYDKILNSKKDDIGHQTREKACEILCIESDRLEMLDLKFKDRAGGIDRNLLENAYKALSDDISKIPPEINYRAAVVIEDETFPATYEIEQFLSSTTETSEHLELLRNLFSQLFDKWKESDKWIRGLIYPGERNSQAFEDQWFRNRCEDFVDATKDFQKFEQAFSKALHAERTVNKEALIASSPSQAREASSEAIPADALKELDEYYREYSRIEQDPKNPFRG